MAATIEQYRSMLADAEADLRDLQHKVQELQAVVAFFKRQIQKLEADPGTPPFPGMGTRNDYGRMKMADAITHVLREHARPMHARDIARQLTRGGWPSSKSLPISVASTCRRHQDSFRKTARNTFGLQNGVDRN